jgi:predicted 3-demethylubiquinone-9 3-methyltransferase (glyoxalase superfamily)
MRKITPCLWFDDKAEEAANFYVSVFSAVRAPALGGAGSRILAVARYGEEGAKVSGKPRGTVMTVTFDLDGQEFMALNGGPVFTFSPAVSFIIDCETQEEIDQFWEKLSDGGKADACGWLVDKYGVSWQVVPTILDELLQDKDSRKTESVMKALIQMKKFDIQGLKRAYEGQ